jgi:hypothetical protein
VLKSLPTCVSSSQDKEEYKYKERDRRLYNISSYMGCIVDEGSLSYTSLGREEWLCQLGEVE